MINHPQKDIFGTTIDVINDAYIVTLEGDIVHPLNVDRYLIEIQKAQLVSTNDEL